MGTWDTNLSYGTKCVDLLSVDASAGAKDYCTSVLASLYGFGSNDSFEINRYYKIYMRYRVTGVDGVTRCGDWAVFTLNKNNWNKYTVGDQENYPGNGEPDDNGNFPTLPDETIPADPDDDNVPNIGGIDLSDIASLGTYLINMFKSLIGVLGVFPTMFASVFSFLPSEIINMIYTCILMSLFVSLVKNFL